MNSVSVIDELGLSQQEIEEFQKILSDPVLFAKHFFNWEARWYQVDMLRNHTNRTVFRCGRRVGKTDTLCILALWYGFTKAGKGLDKRYNILIVTPYDEMAEEIFLRMTELLQNSTLIDYNSLRVKQNPKTIELPNNTLIRFRTAGTANSKGANNLRGKGVDLLILDEADYLADRDIETLLPLIGENPDEIVVLVSSTPSGKRSYFYRWCTDKSLGWKEFHYPSSVNPNWTKEFEQQMRLQYPALAYLHEFEAEFGEEEAGVYQKKFIDQAIELGRRLGIRYITHYDGVQPPKRKGPRVLGVDWDLVQASPTLVGVEFDSELGIYKVLVKYIVPKTEFTLDRAVQDIIALDNLYGFDYIYVDQGMGMYQIEMLKKHYLTQGDRTKSERVVGVNFGSKIEVPDPVTGKKVKKPVKAFMVGLSTMLFERGIVALNPDDLEFKYQLENYRVVRLTAQGVPVYSDKDEHIIDAFNLAILGINSNYSDMLKVERASTVGIIHDYVEVEPKVISDLGRYGKLISPGYRIARMRYLSRGYSNVSRRNW